MKMVAHLKTGKCPKGAVEKRKGRSRRKICYARGSARMSGKGKR